MLKGMTIMVGLIIIGVVLLPCITAYSTGAPSDVCPIMIPNHGVNAQSPTSSPYTVTVSASEYKAGENLTVTLSGSKNFKGFLLMALPPGGSGKNIGEFVVKDKSKSSSVQVGTGNCVNAMTHKQAWRDSPGKQLEFEWTAPGGATGNIQFFATFVEEKTKFWVRQQSAVIGDGVAPAPTTGGPVTNAPALPNVDIKGCGTSKSCYDDCDASNVCGFTLTWKKKDGNDNIVEFELFASLTEAENYVALGLSKDDKMTDVSIVSCGADQNRNSRVQQFYAATRSTPKEQTAAGPVIGTTGTTSSSLRVDNSRKSMTCRFSYDNSVAKTQDDWKDLDEPLFAFIARGPYVAKSLGKHLAAPKISPKQVVFTSSTFERLGGVRVQWLIKAHACIMVLAWVFCASVGLILARYYKPMWSDTKACGQKVWFSYHRALMLSAMFLTVIGFIFILVQNDGVFRTPSMLPTKAHPILGLIAIICALLNPLIAAFRCHPGDSKRPIFNWIHWFFGTVAHVFAIVAIFLGMLIDSVTIPSWTVYIMMVFCLIHVCVEFILEIHQCCMYDKNRDRQEEYTMANKSGAEPKYAGRGFKCAMLVIYMIATTALTIALIVVIAAWGSLPGVTE